MGGSKASTQQCYIHSHSNYRRQPSCNNGLTEACTIYVANYLFGQVETYHYSVEYLQQLWKEKKLPQIHNQN